MYRPPVLIMANTLSTGLIWGCCPVVNRKVFILMLELYALIPAESVARVLIWSAYKVQIGGSAGSLWMLQMEAFTGVIIDGATPGVITSGYYRKTSGIFQQLNLCIGTLQCQEHDPYTAPLNFLNNPDFVIPPP